MFALVQTGPLGFLKVAAMCDQDELEALAGEPDAPPDTMSFSR